MAKNYFDLRNRKRQQLVRKKRIKQLGGILSIIIVLSIAVACVPLTGRISPGIQYEGVKLGFLTEESAKKKLEKAQDNFKNQDVVLTHGKRKGKTSAGILGLSFSPEAVAKEAVATSRKIPFIKRPLITVTREKVDVPLSVDKAALLKGLQTLNGTLYEGAKPARVFLRGGKVVVENGEVGEGINLEDAALSLSKGIDKPVEVKVEKVSPAVSAEALRGIDTVLATWSTDYNPGDKNRAVNVERGASFFRRIILQPGERLSFLETIGGITKENGFVEGETISAGIETKGVGGGVCQVSTTMYNAAVRANLNILSRHNHSKPVDYAAEGTDCAVSDGYKDFIFTNPYQTPIYIDTKADGHHVVCTIFGHGAEKPYVIDLLPERIRTIPAGENWQNTPELKKGEVKVVQKREDGSFYRTYKVYKQGNREIKRELANTSRYTPVDGKYLKGISD